MNGYEQGTIVKKLKEFMIVIENRIYPLYILGELWKIIVLYEVISTTNEFTILVNDEQVDVAFKTIKDLKAL